MPEIGPIVESPLQFNGLKIHRGGARFTTTIPMERLIGATSRSTRFISKGRD